MSSRIPNNFPAKVNVPLKFRNCKKQKNKNETLDMNSCITSTPKGISCNGRNQTPPRLSPILHSVDKVQESETSGEIIKEKKDSYPGTVSLSEPHDCICNARKNILPEIHLIDTSCKGSNSFSSASVTEDNVSSHLDKFASHKLESVHETVSAVLTDTVNVMEFFYPVTVL
jgi:hypothetical protein